MDTVLLCDCRGEERWQEEERGEGGGRKGSVREKDSPSISRLVPEKPSPAFWSQLPLFPDTLIPFYSPLFPAPLISPFIIIVPLLPARRGGLLWFCQPFVSSCYRDLCRDSQIAFCSLTFSLVFLLALLLSLLFLSLLISPHTLYICSMAKACPFLFLQ